MDHPFILIVISKPRLQVIVIIMIMIVNIIRVVLILIGWLFLL